MSIVATCTSSWFIRVYIRSLAGKVSKASESGAMSKVSRLIGAADAEPLP